MSMTMAALIPTYNRPAERLKSLIDNFRKTAFAEGIRYADIFLLTEEDALNISEVRKLPWILEGVDVLPNQRSRNYAGAINTGVRRLAPSYDYLFFGADDILFHQGWLQAALDVFRVSKHTKVVGTNDLLNPYVLKGWHATHYLVDADYLKVEGGIIDGERPDALFEGYSHNFTDTEFIGTAKARAAFLPCLDSVVEHMHWSVGKSERDATAEKAYAGYDTDAALYDERKHLWWDLSR